LQVEVWRGKIHFYGGTIFVFIIFLKEIFLGTRKFGEALPPNAPLWLRAWCKLTSLFILPPVIHQFLLNAENEIFLYAPKYS